MSFDPAFHVIGVSHRTAPVRLRERLALSPDESAEWLERQRAAGCSAVVLSTCNRFEIYWWGRESLESWFRAFAHERGIDPGTALTRLSGEAAVRHLFSVAAGLESQILGETEILGQVRRAYQASQVAGIRSRELGLVFRSALEAGRRVRRETALGRHPASVSSTAVDIALASTARGTGARVVIVGAGEVADGVTRALLQRGVGRVTLVNRRAERAAALAARWGVASRSWAEIESQLASADLVFVTTGAKHPLLLTKDLETAAAGRESELVVLDLAVPRNVEPAARDLPGIRLFDLDQLQELRCPAADHPSIAVAFAQRILTREMVRLDTNLRVLAAGPRLAELHQLGLELAREEAELALSRLHRLSDLERQVIRDLTSRLTRRLLYPVSRTLREHLTQAPDATAS